MINDTIVAPATNIGINQTIAIIRLSGNDAYLIINKIFSKKIYPNKNKIYFGYIQENKEIIDQVILICFEKPYSFTGENIIEINCHGGIIVTNKILNLILKNGGRMAKNGEFTQRAFLNKKINLIQSEAINNLINATNENSIKIAINNLQNKNLHIINEFKNNILDIIANIEVNIDYPEYDGIGNLSILELENKLLNLKNQIHKIIKVSKIGALINNGINVLILGEPNVGKSTLFNALLNEEKAIVSNIKGTTRDFIEGKINIKTLTLNIIDTAGIHKTTNEIEKIGIKKAKNFINNVDLILLMFDSTSVLSQNEKQLLKLTKHKKRILIINKIDLNKNYSYKFKDENVIELSAINRDISNLIVKINELFSTNKIIKNNDFILNNINQIVCLEKIENCLTKALSDSKKKIPVDIININLNEVWNLLNELIGEKYDNNLLNTIFSKYCLGK